jgi:hypothetical protein
MGADAMLGLTVSQDALVDAVKALPIELVVTFKVAVTLGPPCCPERVRAVGLTDRF